MLIAMLESWKYDDDDLGDDDTMMTSVVKADFLKAVRKAVPKRLIRLLYVVNRMNNCLRCINPQCAFGH